MDFSGLNSFNSNSLTKDSLIFPSTSSNMTSRNKKLLNSAALSIESSPPSGLNLPLQENIVRRRTIFPPKNLHAKEAEMDEPS